MLTKHFPVLRGAVALAAVCAASAAQAGVALPVAGAVDYGPPATSVPGLGMWSLALLGLLLAAIAYRLLRGRMGGRLLANLLVVGGVAAAGSAGLGVVQRADAIGAADLSLPGGGSMDLNLGETKVTNTSGVPQQIRALHANPLPQLESAPAPELKIVPTYVFVTPAGTPQCTVGTALAPSASCYVKLDYPPLPPT
ncbi:hypothetical protein GCM10027082_02760 [Comamonas humi]